MLKINLLPPARRVRTRTNTNPNWVTNVLNDLWVRISRQTVGSIVLGLLRLAIVGAVLYYAIWPLLKWIHFAFTGLGIFSEILTYALALIGIAFGIVAGFCALLLIGTFLWYVVVWAFTGDWIFRSERWSE